MELINVGIINWGLFLILLPVVFMMWIIYWLYTGSKIRLPGPTASTKKPSTSKRGNGDLLVEIYDTKTMTIKEAWAKHLMHNTYVVHDDSGKYHFLQLMPTTKVFEKNGVKVVPAKAYDILLYPLDPDIESALELLMNSEKDKDLARITDARELLKTLYKKDEVYHDQVVIPGIGKIAVSFHPHEINDKMIETLLYDNVAAIKHMFKTSEDIDKASEYYKARAEYERAVATKWSTIVIAIGATVFLILLALSMLGG